MNARTWQDDAYLHKQLTLLWLPRLSNYRFTGHAYLLAVQGRAGLFNCNTAPGLKFRYVSPLPCCPVQETRETQPFIFHNSMRRTLSFFFYNLLHDKDPNEFKNIHALSFFEINIHALIRQETLYYENLSLFQKRRARNKYETRTKKKYRDLVPWGSHSSPA